jgi:hypothetical protein
MVRAVRPASRLRAVLWYQGECEVTYKVPYAVYKGALKRLADRVQRTLALARRADRADVDPVNHPGDSSDDGPRGKKT